MLGTDWLTTLFGRHRAAVFVRPVEILLVIVVSFVVAVFGRRLIRRLLGHVARHATREHVQVRAKTIVSLVANLWRFLIAAIAVTTILGIIGLNLTPLLASATVIGATIGFGAQSLVRDYLSGVLIALEDQFGIGDTISVGTTVGVVEEMDLRVTRIRTLDGATWIVPNGEIRVVSNRSRGKAAAVADVSLPRRDPALLAPALEAAIAHIENGDAELSGIIASNLETDTWRALCRTTPARRDAVERELRAALIGAVSRVAPPSTLPQPARDVPSTA